MKALKEASSVNGFSDWQPIIPDSHHDWIGQRNEIFNQFYLLGSERSKNQKQNDAIFRLYSPGMATNRDAYIYNFSFTNCAENAELMTEDYLAAVSELEENTELAVDVVAERHAVNVKWNRELKNNLKRKLRTEYDERYIRKVAYRPFIAMNCYMDNTFITVKGRTDEMFPDSSSENRVICLPGKGLKSPFSVLVTNTITDLNFCEAGARCFPRWRYPKLLDKPDASETLLDVDESLKRIDNISDTALKSFQEHYSDDTITKDDIFYYVYGILHAPSYREQFANDLSKMLPRIPYAPDFTAFVEAGYKLARTPPQLRDV